MNNSNIPMVPGHKESLPKIFGDTPSFLGCDIVTQEEALSNYNAVVMGVPWEGTITWGSYSGCELATKTIRHASARYGAFLPEYGVHALDYLKIADWGDVTVYPSDPEMTMNSVYEKAAAIYRHGAIPFAIGGDHSYTPQIIRALGEQCNTQVAVLHLDSHLDNIQEFGDDRYPRSGPFHHVYGLPCVAPKHVVHFGIRGPRNAPAQFAYAQKKQAPIFTINDIREKGFEQSLSQALELLYRGKQAVYVSICSDILEAAYNPGGPADFDGLTPRELFQIVHRAGLLGIAGLDFVEIYPLQDPYHRSSHLVCWTIIHALVGMAIREKNRTTATSQ